MIIRSNHQPNPTVPAKPCPKVPPLQGRGLPHCPGQPGPVPDHSLSKESLPNIQSEPPLTQLEAIASCPIASYLGEETNTRLATPTPSCQVIVESVIIIIVIIVIHFKMHSHDSDFRIFFCGLMPAFSLD